jgi:hypothetical protein
MRRSVVAVATAAVLAAGSLVGAASTAAAAPLARGGCGWQASMAALNPPAALRSGVLSLPHYAPVNLTLDGNVNWATDPYRDPTWRLWFHSLKWAESLVTSGDWADHDLARAILTDFVADNPDPGAPPPPRSCAPGSSR